LPTDSRSYYITKVMKKAFEAVIFDFGNVLTFPPRECNLSAMQRISGLDRETLQREFRRHRPDYDRGVIEGSEYWSRVLVSGGAEADARRIRELIREDIESWTRINPSVLAWAEELKQAGIKTAILSNMPAELLTGIVSRFSWIEDFDASLFSCRLGMIKPEPGIYQACLEALEVEAGRSVFVDDSIENVQGAKAVGMEAIHHLCLEDTLERLRSLGLLKTAALSARMDP
jgi:putative hydrolase of the HAD superfamily